MALKLAFLSETENFKMNVQVPVTVIDNLISKIQNRRYSDNDEGDAYQRQDERFIKYAAQFKKQGSDTAIIPDSLVREHIRVLHGERFSDNDEGDYYRNQNHRYIQYLNNLLTSK